MKRVLVLIASASFFMFVAGSSVSMAQVTPPTSTLLPTYKSIREGVFVTKCLMCHAPGGHADDLPLQDYDLMIAEGELVVPFDLTKSLIVKEMEAGDMPPRRSGIAAVTPLELAAIKTWIVNGAVKE